MKRRQLSILFNGLIFFLLPTLSAFAQSTPAADDTAAASEMGKRDRDFSALSVEKGMPAASSAYFADDGIAFAPRAVNGKKYYGAQKEFPGTLVWQPIFAASSHAGDLGYTTGPWELKNSNKADVFGNYVTVWKKRVGEEWKVALDIGVNNPQPTEAPAPLQLLPAQFVSAREEEARRNFRRAQRTFAERAKEEIGQALIANATPEIRILRDNSSPAVGTSGAQIILGAEHGKVVQEPLGTTLSRSGDLAFSYGNYSAEHGNVTDHGIYLTIWQIDLNGDWKIALDLRKKVAPEAR